MANALPAEARKTVAAKLAIRLDWVETTLSQSHFKYEVLCREGFAKETLASIDAIR